MCLRPCAALKEADSVRCRGNPTTRTPFFRSFLSREVKASGTASRVAGRRLARCLQKNEKTYRQTDGTHPLEERRAAAHRSNLLLNHHILPRQAKFVNGFFCFFENFQNKVKRIVYGLLTITLYVLIMYTSWYTAFFTALFMATFIVIYVCVASSNKNKVFSNVWMYIKKC